MKRIPLNKHPFPEARPAVIPFTVAPVLLKKISEPITLIITDPFT
jgi:hypothetical protein